MTDIDWCKPATKNSKQGLEKLHLEFGAPKQIATAEDLKHDFRTHGLSGLSWRKVSILKLCQLE